MTPLGSTERSNGTMNSRIKSFDKQKRNFVTDKIERIDSYFYPDKSLRFVVVSETAKRARLFHPEGFRAFAYGGTPELSLSAIHRSYFTL